jgi:putative PEP-CTERM system histidine kinase
VTALIALRGRTSRTGVAIILCCLASAVWAGATAAGAPTWAQMPLDGLRLSSWLLFAAALVTARTGAGNGIGRPYLFVAGVFCLAAIGNDLWSAAAGDMSGIFMSQLLFRIGFGVFGLLTIENLWRNTEPARRWHVWPICLALGLLFVYELFLFSDAFITRGRVDSGLAAGRAIAAAFMAPLLALAIARNREWRVDIHVSRQVVLHTATLMASGCFLLAVALVAMLLRGFGGDWGLVLQLAMLLGSIVVLGTVLSSGSLRQRLKFLISRNFFSNRYDYRVEWLKFIELISEPQQAEELPVRIIRALAGLVDSPAGSLWSLQPGIGYRQTASWRLPRPNPTLLPHDDPFLAGFRDGGWVQTRSGDLMAEPWPFASGRAWLAVPLRHRNELIGFVVLDRADHSAPLDWEAFDLLRATGRQAASYLAEERSARGLRDAELLTEYSKRFAFVVHDIKNLASQLGLIVSNAKRHLENPEFQRDMLHTVEDAVARMNHLLDQLKADAAPRQQRPLDPAAVAAAVADRFAGGPVAVEVEAEAADYALAIEPDRLKSALTHLVQNAIDASRPGDRVVIALRRLGSRAAIDVVDRGPGMPEAFIRDELFLPFRSTKSGGYGIGAFQTRELIRAAGGDLEVFSAPGNGTTMRIVLPLTAPPQTMASQRSAAAPSAAA